MKRGFIICLLVFGLACALEDNVGSETKESSQSINFRFLDKNKRGATKITNTDNPSFNHLSSTNTVSSSTSSSSSSGGGGFKPTAATSNPPPFRYLYNQHYYQPNPYLTYVQLPQAAQIAAQYSFQANPVAHFLQTPTQIQYVATPTIAHQPQIKYQSFTNEYQTANSVASDSSSTSTSSAQYVPQPQQAVASSSHVASASSGGSSQTVSQNKQVQVPFFSGYQTGQPVYYTQQPLFTYFQQPQAANFIYQQPNANYLLKQQQQLANVYGGNRFGFYTPTQNTQLTYLVPMVITQPEQEVTSTTANLKSSSDKAVAQQSASTNSFSYGTKA